METLVAYENQDGLEVVVRENHPESLLESLSRLHQDAHTCVLARSLMGRQGDTTCVQGASVKRCAERTKHERVDLKTQGWS